jgi:hypothetical protein
MLGMHACVAGSLADAFVRRAATNAMAQHQQAPKCRERVTDQTAVALLDFAHLSTPMAREQHN